MKLIKSNGKRLDVYDIGEGPIMTLVADKVPIKVNGVLVLKEDEARDVIRALLQTGLYEKSS